MKKNIFIILLILITAIGLLFRFWHYPDRFGLAYDQAHDALVAREAIRQMKIPLVGPFSSAGPFQTSGTWYWLLMVPTALYPASMLSPWIFLTVLCGCLIIGLGVLGRVLEKSYIFGVIAALLAAVSTAFIAQSVNLTNQTPLSVFSFLTIASCLWYIRKKSLPSAFFMGFFAGFGASIHLQGMALSVPVAVSFLLGGKIKVTRFLFALFGACLPMLPILLWDTSNDYINIKNMIYYYRYDQFNISLDVLGRRWLTYITDFWPKEWAHIIGGHAWIAIGLAVLAIVFFLYFAVKRQLRREWLFIFLSFAGVAVIIRYTRVPLFSSFITFTHPFIILISAWVIYRMYRINRMIGALACIIVLSFTMVKTWKEVFSVRSNLAMIVSEGMYQMLTRAYPNDRFRILDWNYDDAGKSLPFVLYLDDKGVLSDNGRTIGISKGPRMYFSEDQIISSASGYITDLSSTSSAFLARDNWKSVNPSSIYRETEEWRH